MDGKAGAIDPLLDPLTERELDILSLMVEGCTNREIGAALHLAETTVKWHNTQIFEKLAVRTRREAVARCAELGLLSARDEAAEDAKHNLPWQTTLFVGRHQEMSELARLLSDPDIRLITILGAGGMGKTRLALEVARAHLGHFADGVYFVPLAPLSSGERLGPAIAESLGFRFHEERDPQAQLLRFLAGKRMLLTLDNFEHLLDGAGLVTEMLQAAPGVTVLATSREKLALRSETVYAISGLPFPDWDVSGDARAYSAVGLFIQSAQRTRPDFVADSERLQRVARICRLVEGMPLAILLAAAWVDALSLEEIADEISQGLDLLEVELRDMPAHQRSIRATFDRSWKRLSAAEQDIFMRLSVFRGGCTREAAQTVTGASLPALQALVNKSLLWRTPEGRYDIHELLRQYAAEKLEEADETHTAHDAHCAYFIAFLRRLEPDIKGRRQLGGLKDLAAEFDNARAAWDWAVDRRDYAAVDQALECLYQFCWLRGRYQDGAALFERARQGLAPQPGDEPHPVWERTLVYWPPDRAQVEQGFEMVRQRNAVTEMALCCRILGWYAFETGDYDTVADWWQQAVKLHQSVGDKSALVSALRDLAHAFTLLGRFDEAKKLCQQAVALGRETGNIADMAVALHLLGSLASLQGSYAESDSFFAEAIALHYEYGCLVEAAWAEAEHGRALLLSGALDRARQVTQTALDTAIESSVQQIIGWTMSLRAHIAYMDEDYAWAKTLAEDALELLRGVRPELVSFTYLTLGLALLGLGDEKTARRCGVWALKEVEEGAPFLRVTVLLALHLQAPVLIRAHDAATTDDRIRVVEWLGLILTHPTSPKHYYALNPLITRLRADLEAELGSDVYAAAWERGQTLDYDTVVDEFLAEYGE